MLTFHNHEETAMERLTRIKGIFRLTGVLAGTAAMVLSANAAMAQASLTVVHAAPFAPSTDGTSVTVSANGMALAENFVFGDFAELEVPAGDYDLAVTPTGASDPAITGMVTLADGMSYTVLAVGDDVRQPLDLQVIVDGSPMPAAGNLALRVIHAAPFAKALEDTEVSIRTAGGTVVNGLVGIPYGGNSGFFELPAGSYDLKVSSNDGSTNLIDPLEIALLEGEIVTLIAVGDGQNQPLGILAIPGGLLPTRPPVDNSANGWWGTPNTAGSEGIIAQPIPAENRIVGTIYTFDNGTPVWFLFDSCSPEVGGSECLTPGDFDGRMAGGLVYRFTGGDFAGDDPSPGELAGGFVLEFLTCDSASIFLEIEGEPTVTLDLARIVQNVPCTLDD